MDHRMAESICPVEDCYLHIDLLLESSDGIIFGAHKANLEQFSAGFPIAEATNSDNEVVTLSENGSVLRLILQLMHNTRQPDLRTIKFRTLELLAEAVEKYMIFSAMQVCKLCMEKCLNIYPLEVFLYAVKHDYGELADKTAPSLIRTPLEKFVEHTTAAGLPASTVVQFFRYRERWSNLLTILYGNIPFFQHRGGGGCDKWEQFYTAILLDVKLDSSSLSRFSNTVNEHKDVLDECSYCWMRVEWLKTKISDGIRTIPSFSKI